MLDLKRVLAAKPKEHADVQLTRLMTPWGEQIDPANVLPEHPTPQFARAHYEVLNGWWDCAFTRVANEAPDPAKLPMIVDAAQTPPPAAFGQRILVPFSPEAPLSGVNRQLRPGELLWYRRRFTAPALSRGDRLVLHFQAVDHTCSCRINGKTVGGHAGGYTAFAFDITNYLVEGENEIVLCVADSSEFGQHARGKQRLDRGDIWYTAQSGIWQTVWMEQVPANRIDWLAISTDAYEGSVTLRIALHDSEERGHVPQLAVEIRDAAGAVVAADSVEAGGQTCGLQFHLHEPHLWSPEDPYLYTMLLSYGADVVSSYFGIRSAEVRHDERGKARFYLNGKPCFLKGVLDQGYWPDGLLTAPSDAALMHDIEAAKAAGFNMMRKHIKRECARWYYHCDRLGMLVWQDRVNGGAAGLLQWQWSYKPTLFTSSWSRFDDTTAEHHEKLGSESPVYRREWMRTTEEIVKCLNGHPCVVTWVLFNEGWGQFDSAAACEHVRRLDPTRPIDTVSGWYDQGAGDFKSVHNYFRSLTVWPDKSRDGKPKRAFVISECGGLTLRVEGHSSLPEAYGYAAYEDAASWAADLRKLLAKLDSLERRGLAGYVYTQLSDIEEEVNGLLTYDRRVNKLG